ncbi:LLM class flavin-dependent oxidoreductase [Mycobacterium yunnanensis]|uniref:LLM class flavin-dependent oxidoreductase n=1 Tax=Mycobacterium yunnanensis TaxID=368477 RepID=A0A9X2Z0X3_9MYCO|nr:LLM class flavin-dependent oxidoreductase [Mycobacterium yunnanensis]MCV7420976.1 LLM class flavin-dependent oxidoreductase [Mycobacterium yunnanensis]
MRFSVWPSTTQPWDDVLELATFSDDGFWHSIYVADHFMSPGDEPGRTSDWLEATAVMAALATVTSNIRLANLVLSMTFRHPAVLANLAVTIDRISNGRFTLGLGAGWQITEHEQYGLALGEPKERVDRFAEGLAVISGLLTNETTTFDGHYYQLKDALCEPKPLQSPLPLLVGGTGPRMLRLIARHAHEWNQWSSPGGFGENSKALDAACEKEGRDPATVWRSTQAVVIVTDSAESEAKAKEAAESMPQPVVYGPAERIAEAAATWRDEGVDEVIVPDFGMPRGPQRLDSYRALAEAFAPLA